MSAGRLRRNGRAPQEPATVAPPNTAKGLVLASYRRHFAVLLDDGKIVNCVLRGRSLTLACGDRVRVALAAEGGAVEAVDPRSSLFYRSDGFNEKLIAANVTQVIGVVAPDLSIDEELLTRWIVGAETQHCRFVLVANKSDLPGFDRLLQRVAPFAAMGYTVLTLSAVESVERLLPIVAGQCSVLIGQSGMGKSTILNALAPGAVAKTAEVSQALGTGRHTTTHATLYPLPQSLGGGFIVDSPGMKAFGLAHVPPDTIADAFAEFRPRLGDCRFRDCQHDREPGCALVEAVERGEAAPYRLTLLRTLIAQSRSVRGPGER